MFSLDGSAGSLTGLYPGHLGPVPVAVGDGFPQRDGAVLEVPVLPERGHVRRVVAVPVLVLAAGQRVQVDDRPDPVRGQHVDHPVQVREPGLLDLERPVVVLEVPVVHRDPHRVHAQRRQVRGVVRAEEPVQELVEERLAGLLPHRLAQRRAHQLLRPGVAGDEVLHVHPPPSPTPVSTTGAPVSSTILEPATRNHGNAVTTGAPPLRRKPLPGGRYPCVTLTSTDWLWSSAPVACKNRKALSKHVRHESTSSTVR
ncbi:hypothetical protein R4I43_30120 [Saccharopolyspora sp. S2-29]|uniref:Uncharacterized protein n=1 Tax=Saccharopolyspora mangrovi TaxID=3082379 RepID=A0ABU6AJQ7_9PSEU|nr:hypothetical protein [Saccharopolyspora sp. S2-29]MEB3371668.1 hypothetical protein [Saccharopolyspora sp. S2-29]